jgi:NO-binding membrane sensor protein with MHYT domain/GGDEF domain-containing protein
MTLMMPVACALSYAVLEAAGRVRAAHGPTRVAWLIGGSLVVGLSIWSMHFVALLELRGPLPLAEDPVTLGVAAVTAVIAAAGALNHVNRGVAGVPALAVSGGLKGFALVATHYTTMAALHTPATISYDARLFGWSVVLAVAVSTATLWFAERLRSVWQRLAVAVAMGGGLAVMHQVAVRAGHFVPDALWREESRGASVHALSLAWLAPWVTAATILAVAGLAAVATADRRRAVRHRRTPAGDRLTGLANGSLLQRHVATALAAGAPCAVVRVHGNGLDALRQGLGARAAEQLLVRVGWRLVGAAGGHGVAARLSGAEYAVLVHDAAAADAVADRIRERLAVPVSSDGVLVLLPVAVGVAVARAGEKPRSLLERAGLAAEGARRRPLAAVAEMAGA